MKHLLIILLLLCNIHSKAQDCNKEQLKTLEGKWLPQPGDAVGGNYRRPSTAEIAGAKKTLAKIKQFFQEKYRPVGMDTYHHYHFLAEESTDKNIYGNSSVYTIRNFLFHCVKGKKETSEEGLGSYVHINPVDLLKFSSIPVLNEYGKVNEMPGFHALTSSQCPNGKLPDFSEGYYILETISSYIVFITHKGKQPFRYVSRKEFLEKQIAICEANLKDLNKHYTSKTWKEQLEMFPQFREKMLKDSKEHLAMYERPINAYKEDLKKDAAWLNEMSIVQQVSVKDPKTNQHQYSRFDFTSLKDPYNNFFVPIMPNPDYYNRKLPKWEPQFIVIDIREHNSFISKEVRKVVEKNIDFFRGLVKSE